MLKYFTKSSEPLDYPALAATTLLFCACACVNLAMLICAAYYTCRFLGLLN